MRKAITSLCVLFLSVFSFAPATFNASDFSSGESRVVVTEGDVVTRSELWSKTYYYNMYQGNTLVAKGNQTMSGKIVYSGGRAIYSFGSYGPLNITSKYHGFKLESYSVKFHNTSTIGSKSYATVVVTYHTDFDHYQNTFKDYAPVNG